MPLPALIYLLRATTALAFPALLHADQLGDKARGYRVLSTKRRSALSHSTRACGAMLKPAAEIRGPAAEAAGTTPPSDIF